MTSTIDVGGLPKGLPRGKTAERILFAEMLSRLETLQATQTAMMERYQGRTINSFLYGETFTFDANGYKTFTFHAVASCVQVENLGETVAQVATTVFNNVSVPATSTSNSTAVSTANAQQVRPLISASGPDIITKLQGSNDGSAWFDLATYAAGAVGWQSAVAVPGLYVRLSANNTAAGPESITAQLVTQSQDLSTSTHTVTVAPGGAASSAPSAGANVYKVPAATSRTAVVNSTTFTVYGAAGDMVSVQVFTSAATPGVG